ncbi:MAG: hypothetical protein WAV05_11195 [Anaerolineales bacterium]
MVPRGLQVGSQGGIRFVCVGELVQDQDHGLVADQLDGSFKGVFPCVEARHGLALRVRPALHCTHEPQAQLGRSISVGHPVDIWFTGMLDPIEQESGFAHSPAAVNQDELRTTFGDDSIEFFEFAGTSDKFIHL